MKISVARGELAEALSIAGKGLSSRTTLPILSGILLSASGDELTLQSTDLEVSIRDVVKANVKKEGQTVVPGRLVTDIVRSLPEAAVTVDATAHDHAVITCGHSSFTVRTLSPDDFPKFPEVKTEKKASIPTETLVSVVRQVSKAVSRDETRPILTGMLTSIEGDTLRMVATDSYRLAVREVTLASAQSEAIEVVVPGKAMEEVPKLAGDAESVTIGVSENQIVFEFGGTVYVSRRIEGNFPNYRQLIPKEKETLVTVDREELLEAVKRVSLLAQHNAPLRLKVTESTLTLSAQTADVGEATEDLMVQTEGKDVEIAFNHAFLLDGVGAATSEQVVLEILSPLKPGVLRPVGNEELTYLLMPVRLG
ncbi:MAG TPA: DNA polymerase III subunit beta [Coriobacteriia bacterium]|jgi:DNA polymerase-3 subunit beta